MNATPAWLNGLFGIATWGGLAGAVLLFMKRRLAVTLLLVSLIAAILQFGSAYLMFDMWNLLGGISSAFMPALVIILGLFFWNYAKGAAAKGWLK